MSARSWRFAVWSLLGILAVLVLLSTVYHRLVGQHLEGQFGDVAVVLANVLGNAMVEDGLVERLDQNNAGSVSDTLRWQWVDKLVRRHITGLNVAKVKIYDHEGKVEYSSDRQEVGRSAVDNPGVRTALSGGSLANIVHRDEVNSFDGVVENRNLHQQYIPLRTPNGGEILGVFEVYSDVTGLLQRIDNTNNYHSLVLAAVLGWFFLGQMWLYFRADRALAREQQQTKTYLAELERSQQELETRVLERTRELEESRHFLQSVIDGIASPVMVINPDLTVSMLNSAAKRQAPGDVSVGRLSCYQVSHHLDTPCDSPDHPCLFDEVLKRGTTVTLRHTHSNPVGTPQFVDVISTPLRDESGALLGVIEVHHDVTELVQTQEGLVQSEARLQAIMDNVPDAILTYDRSGRIDTANQVAARLFDLQQDQVIGASITDLICGEPLISLEKDSDLLEQSQTLEAWAMRGDARFPIDLWMGSLSITGRQRWIAVARDISERKRAEKELEQTRRQYYHQEKMAAIGQLAAGILHEVGNPIAAITGAAEELRERVNDHCEKEPGCHVSSALPANLNLILQQTDRLAKITRDIADFAAPRPMERELLDLNGLIRSTVRLVGYDSRFRGITLDLALDPNLPAVYGVADQLTQVLMNLLINAMDGVSETESPRIEVSTREHQSNIEMSVRDNGVGMSADTLDRAMEPFFTTKPVGKGTGLGLSLCETIVSSHQGELSIDSQQGQGTTLTLRLPNRKPDSGKIDTGEDG